MDFSIEIKDFNQYKIIAISGDLNMFNAQIFKTHGEVLLGEDQHMAIDLSETNYIDSSGMGAILNLLKAQKAKELDLPLINANDRVIEVFKLVKIDKIFTLLEDYGELPEIKPSDESDDDLDLELDTRVE